jgi:antitoxin ParD1/3/4
MTSINISLPESMKAYVEEQVTSGGYGTVSEYMRELIRQDQKRKAKERLETLLLEGLDSGPATAMTARDWEDIRQAVRDKIVQRNRQNSIDG